MKASDKFLKLYVKDLDVSGKEFAEKITLTGTKIETFEKLDKNLDKIVVVEIKKIEKHPNADKLVICHVFDGKENIQIVTGANNVYEGMICPACLVGGKVAASAHDNIEYPDGIKIKEGKLRGVESHGMLCSIDELGRNKELYGDIDGIYDMGQTGAKPGDDAIKVLGLDDTLYDFEITSNRIDCYSVIGIAKEVAATFNKKFVLPNISYKAKFNDSSYININVENKDMCPLFATKYIKNVKIEESPEWMKTALRAVGIRPINNIVDITNFVMMEFGQPMHAYDYDMIRDKKINVKFANDGDKFKTLDGVERILDRNVLTISDGEGIIGLAGIMGGENSMITENCKNLLFEVANFNGTNIRLSSKRLGIRTEASNLFEKGLDANNAILAINRACELIDELNCGDICEDFIYFYPDENLNKQKIIEVSVSKVNSLLGTNINAIEMKEILDKIDLSTKILNDNLIINVPSIRKDINNFADIAEEVMRFYGYDKAESTLPKLNIYPKSEDVFEKLLNKAYNIAVYNGFDEAMNYSFESEKVYDNLLFPNDAKERNYIKILNPLGEDFQIMRTQLINGMLKSLSINYNRRNKSAKLFEIANIYLPLDKEIKVLPDERKTFLLGGYGEDLDFYTFKGYAEEFLSIINFDIRNINFLKNDTISYMHPGRTANIIISGTNVGFVGEVNELVLKNYGIEEKVFVVQFDLNTLSNIVNFDKKYVEISKFPYSERDLSMTVPKDIIASKIEDVFIKFGGKLLNSFNLFDIYEGEQIANGYKSMAYNLRFSSNERSLKVEEIDEIISKIITHLNEFGIELRK